MDLESFIKEKIEEIRPRLLDLTKRNPLISARLNGSNTNSVRFVDELPDELLFSLTYNQTMQIVPLPSLDEDPADENTEEFKNAFSNALLTDERYLEGVRKLEGDDTSTQLNDAEEVERALKDRLREKLEMPPRATKTTDVVQHAKNNGITPGYDLPSADDQHEDGRHTDALIQTLMLPIALERRLNGILTKRNSFIQETGLNVVRVAFGLLEWAGQKDNDSVLSPLVILNCSLERKPTKDGYEFYISAMDDNAESNLVLAEKLNREFGISLPVFEGGSVEDFIREVENLKPGKMKTWRTRRQALFGIFPSSKLAMYHELDTFSDNFKINELIEKLLGGPGSAGADGLYAETYEIDEPANENKVPYLVSEADSSQFSTLIDLANGKSLAVEGPPGTGKSQTIVNAIASALADGKKVLFVAEKLAALNVVKSRLENVKLGEFILPLQAGTSSRQQIVQSLRERLKLGYVIPPKNFSETKESFEAARARLSNYSKLHSQLFAETGFSIGEVLERSTANEGVFNKLPPELRSLRIHQGMLNQKKLNYFESIEYQLVNHLEDARGAAKNWKGVRLSSNDRFSIEEALNKTLDLQKSFDNLARAEVKLITILSLDTVSSREANELLEAISAFDALKSHDKTQLISDLLTSGSIQEVAKYVGKISSQKTELETVQSQLASPITGESIQQLKDLLLHSKKLKLQDYSEDHIKETMAASQRRIYGFIAGKKSLDDLVKLYPDAVEWNAETARVASSLANEAGVGVLALRNTDLLTTNTIPLLQKHTDEGSRLKKEQDNYNQEWRLDQEFRSKNAAEAAQRIRDAGVFKLFSKEFKEAKALFRSLWRGSKFNVNEAALKLEELAEFLRKKEAYENNIQVKNLFGIHFDGLQTPFEDFRKLADFLNSVDTNLPGLAHASLRRLVKSEEKDVLDLLPSITKAGAMTIDELRKFIDEKEAQFEEEKQNFQITLGKAHILEDANLIDPDGLQNLIARVEACQLETNQIVAPSGIPSSWADVSSTDCSVARTNEMMDVAQWCLRDCIARVRRGLSKALNANSLQELEQNCRTYIEFDETLKNAVLQFKQLTQLKVEEIYGARSTIENVTYWQEASGDESGLRYWQEIAEMENLFVLEGLSPVFEYHIKSEVQDGRNAVVSAIFYNQLARFLISQHDSELKKFNKPSLEATRNTFKSSDKNLMELNKQKLRSYLAKQADAPIGNAIGPKRDWTELSLIYNETEKKKRFISTRDLVARAGKALQELKPCWMMSPLAVSQYIKAGQLDFDLVIIDEASQMTPENALGALMRGKQAMIVGDTNQLPPTNFFNSAFTQDDDDNEAATTEESILEIANGTFRPKRLLEWHYRSKDSRLISFCNKHIYGNNLIVFPSASEGISDTGVFYKKADGLYKGGTNPIEAKVVIDAVIQHMQDDPNRSLGVVALNKKQAELLQREFDLALISHDGPRDFVEKWETDETGGLESFFIKNLENVQGDERDVIFISTVYGPETEGARTLQRFGPIAGVQGKRRLNVLFSRAKEKIVTFSSMTSADITSTETQNPGSFMLKSWLEYVVTGADLGTSTTDKEPDSEFEVFVIDQLKSMGCEPVPQVGAAGFFIDIGVRHPDWPHGFIMAVECDGAAYHSSKSARDRDRYRQDILEGLGWSFYRIWSTDWFSDPRGEANKLRVAIENRLAQLKNLQAEKERISINPENHFVDEISLDLPLSETSENIDSIETNIMVDEESVDTAFLEAANTIRVQIGDLVTLRYQDLIGDRFQFTISEKKSDPANGIIGNGSPIAQAILDAEEGEIVDILRGSKFVQAEIESISREASKTC
ncbi:MAG: DUF4011 domain-containing protein [Hyphomicrobiales bacterium]